ncbi:MAG: 4-hydroxy-tetrahydrodipicolinate synthase [Actinomycetota bacterium]
MASDHLRGVFVPVITPYAPDGSVALDALEGLGHRLLDGGVAGLVALGTTGEASLLEAEEKRAVVDVCSRACRDRGVPLIVGVGTNDTAESIASARAIADVPGVTAALCVVPYYLRPSQEGIVQHFKAIAAASSVPIVLYNIPYRTGTLLEPDGLLQLASMPEVIGVKHAVGSIDGSTLRILAEKPEGFAILGGDDPYLFPMMLLGASGAIAASAHVCTERFVDMVECGMAGKVEEGRSHHEELLPVVAACFAEPSPAVFKAVLHAQGVIPTPDVRLPLVAASAEALERALHSIDAVP